MVTINEVSYSLAEIGRQIRALRIARGDSQELFAARIGVSRPTIRAIENGEPTVQIGHWMAACWALNRLGEVRDAFTDTTPLLDRPLRPRLRAGRKIGPKSGQENES